MELNILYTVNQKYIDKMLVSILSLLESNIDKKINLHIVTEDFNLEDIERIENILCKYKNITVQYYDIHQLRIEKYKIDEWRGTQIPNARLFFQDFIELDGIDNLIYLDADTVVVDDLEDLLTYESAVNAVTDPTFKHRLEELGLRKYYNSGVILFNIEKWIKEDCLKVIVDTIAKNQNRKFNYPDQDILNLALSEEIGKLPFSYNMPPYCFVESSNFLQQYFNDRRLVTYDEVMEALKDPHIFHAYGLFGIKPWTNNNVNPFNDIYNYYLSEIDSNYKKDDLGFLKKMMSMNPQVFYSLVLAKNLMPKTLERKLRSINIKLQ